MTPSKRKPAPKAPDVEPVKWPPENGPWSKVHSTLCGRATTAADRQLPYSVHVIDGPMGGPWLSLFDCGCDKCRARARLLSSRHLVDIGLRDLASGLGVDEMTLAHAVALAFEPKASPRPLSDPRQMSWLEASP